MQRSTGGCVEVAEGDADGGTGGGRDGVVEDDDKVANKERRRPRPAPPFQAEKTRCAARHVIVSTTPHVLHVLSLGTEQICIWSPLFSCFPQASCTLYSGRWAPMASRKLTLFYEGGCFANTQHAREPIHYLRMQALDLNHSTTALCCVRI